MMHARPRQHLTLSAYLQQIDVEIASMLLCDLLYASGGLLCTVFKLGQQSAGRTERLCADTQCTTCDGPQ